MEGNSFEEGPDPLCLNRMLRIDLDFDLDFDSLEVCRNTDCNQVADNILRRLEVAVECRWFRLVGI